MTTIMELWKSCDALRCEHQEELINVLNKFMEDSFLYPHRPWRAVVGNKKCKPIPVYRYIQYPDENVYNTPSIVWPRFSKGRLRRELEDLGFIVTGERICLSVPPVEYGETLTFAQQYVKEINYSYSIYCDKQKKIAKRSYQELLSLLQSEAEKGNAYTFDDYTFFPKLEMPKAKKVSPKCYTFIRRLMAIDGIEEVFEDKKYMGIKVFL